MEAELTQNESFSTMSYSLCDFCKILFFRTQKSPGTEEQIPLLRAFKTVSKPAALSYRKIFSLAASQRFPSIGIHVTCFYFS